MRETCKTCRKEFDSGIWLAPQFRDEKVLLFCSDKCKNKYLKNKLEHIKRNYPKYYQKIMKDPYENRFFTDYIKRQKG